MTIALLMFFIPSLKTIRGEKVESKDEGFPVSLIACRIHHDVGHCEEASLGPGASVRRRLRACCGRGAERLGDVDRLEDEPAGRAEHRAIGKGFSVVPHDVPHRGHYGYRRNLHVQHRLRQHHDPRRHRRRHVEQDQSARLAVPCRLLLQLRVFAAFVHTAQLNCLYQ